ncbi:MAG: alanine--tRNA ligase [Desulfovibrionaceae bacterium]|nr:alanine--tRNA ligase [Desulfovibrionaceae bacterium]
MLTAADIRERYLNFFKRHQHEVVRSGPLIPEGDKTLLFTNAGMVQFKQLFLGAEKRSYSRATTCQKCLRVSGKHNDLENVGRTARHHTFFEMLGNFSFGDYFKKEAITWAWEFVTEELSLPPEKLWVTIYRDDEEAALLWKSIAGLPDERIVRMDEKDNFWTMGDTGPCGPCSEIYIDQGSDMACGESCGIGRCDCDRFLEIWNLVFTQFDQNANGGRTLLAAPNIDTGMGLERIAAVCQGKRSNFDCDLFQDLIQYAAKAAHVTYSESAPDTNDVDTALRVIADHSRAAAFLIAEGVLPSNEGRGYVLRRLIRRALRFATLLNVREPFLHGVVSRVIQTMGSAYPELLEQEAFIPRVVYEEEQKFSQTLENGLLLLEAEIERVRGLGEKRISGDFCFLLYDTHGFPLDIVTDVAEKQGFLVDEDGFEQRMREQRERARASQKQSTGLGHVDTIEERLKRLAVSGATSVFTGYESYTETTAVTSLLDAEGEVCSALPCGAVGYVVTEKTPFYGESGGQVADTGLLRGTDCEAEILAVTKPTVNLPVHQVRVTQGTLTASARVTLAIDDDRRKALCRNHTATHLLHAALRRVLGNHVHQMGSLVDQDHLRFDFSHIAALTSEELARVEEDVNRVILADLPVVTRLMDREEAKAQGAMALFDDKYGDRVRVVTIADTDNVLSRELCGGTHLERTGQAGSFFILSESGVASGTRRIEAVTGWNSYRFARKTRETLERASSLLKSGPDQLCERIETLVGDLKTLRKEKASTQNAAIDPASLLERVRTYGAVRLLCARLDNVPKKALLDLMDTLRSSLDTNAVVVLASVVKEKVSLLLYVSRNLHERLTAPELIREAAASVGGSGGGRPDLAQAGGTKPEGITSAFACVERILKQEEA